MNDMNRAESFIAAMGLEEVYREYVDSYQSTCIFTKAGSDTQIELVVPTGGNLYGYNEGKGGLHHIAYLVDDVEAIRKEYKKEGIILLEPKAVKGAGNIIVNFLRPRNAFGILVEFVQEF